MTGDRCDNSRNIHGPLKTRYTVWPSLDGSRRGSEGGLARLIGSGFKKVYYTTLLLNATIRYSWNGVGAAGLSYLCETYPLDEAHIIFNHLGALSFYRFVHTVLAIYGPLIYTVPYVVGGGWALEIETFFGPWEMLSSQ